MKPQNEVTSGKQKQTTFWEFFFFNLTSLTSCLHPPSLASRAFHFILAIRITSLWLWHYISLPWWWQQVFLLFWNKVVIVIVLSKKVQSASALKSTRQAKGLSIFCRARKPCVRWVQPVTLLSPELSGSPVTKWQITGGVFPFWEEN